MMGKKEKFNLMGLHMIVYQETEKSYFKNSLSDGTNLKLKDNMIPILGAIIITTAMAEIHITPGELNLCRNASFFKRHFLNGKESQIFWHI